MTAIAQFSKSDARNLERRFQRAIHGSPGLDAAAQEYTRIVYEALHESIVLLRLFATIPYAALPRDNRGFVEQLCASVGARDALTDDTLVLSLLGTMGVEPRWCERRASARHVGIPLISEEFVTTIPMISRLLKQLGVELDWIARKDMAIVGKTFGLQSGVFYVEDARAAVDSQGRKIITAQDFVAEYGVRTVYGVGGGYVGSPVYTTIISFCRDHVEQDQAESFRSHIDRFKAETTTLVDQGRFFSG